MAEEQQDAPQAIQYGRCPACGYVMLPVLTMSPCGHADEPQLIDLVEPGRVYSWTRVWEGEEQTANVLVMADFLGGHLRVSAPLLGAGGVEIGDAVQVTAGTKTPYALIRLGSDS